MKDCTDLPDTDGASGVIVEAITAAGGWLSFAQYMDLALYAPGVGYYTGEQRKFGAAGDFVTASGISHLFGATLARQVSEICAASRPYILEFGAGTGALAADILAAIGDTIDSYRILELSPDLRLRQQACLEERVPHHAHRVRWLDRLPTRFSGCIIANEVLDAMPVHLVHWADNGTLERGITKHGAGLRFADRQVSGEIAASSLALADAYAIDPPYTSEIALAARGWIGSLADLLETGAAVLIDYGFPAREYYHPQRSGGTLMCHYRHRAIDDPLYLPGLADLSAHVDFSALATAGDQAGLELLGYTSQANFLLNCGITDLLAATAATDSMRYLPLANQANRLLSPAEMGELFKVMALGRGIDDSLVGFTRGDRRHTL